MNLGNRVDVRVNLALPSRAVPLDRHVRCALFGCDRSRPERSENAGRCVQMSVGRPNLRRLGCNWGLEPIDGHYFRSVPAATNQQSNERKVFLVADFIKSKR